jgi:hypothetical protein
MDNRDHFHRKKIADAGLAVFSAGNIRDSARRMTKKTQPRENIRDASRIIAKTSRISQGI